MINLPFHNYLINLSEDCEIVYDMSQDRIGDAIGSLPILQHICVLNPKLKLSVIYCAKDNGEYSWHRGINLFDWSDWKPHTIYNYFPSGKVIFNSVDGSGFSIWGTLHRLNLQPKLRSPSNISHTERNVSMHIINAVGIRNKPYVSRRTLSMEKYEQIGKYLVQCGITVTRLGAEYDRIRDFDSCINDLTSQNLTLHDTFTQLAKSDLFMGGDSGLTHAAAALGIPVIAEVDPVSKSAKGLAGIPQNLLTEIPYNCNFETHLQLLQNHPLLKDRITI